ncbi:MAG: DUF1127 domain-containing protein [Kiloniellales bacterium]
MNIWFNAIARAGGIEVPTNARLASATTSNRADGPHRPGLTRRLARSLAQAAWRLLCRLETWRRTRTAIRELRALPDRILWDIGLPRGEIHTVVEAMVSGSAGHASPPDRGAEVLPFKRSYRPAKIGPCERAA